MKRLKFLAVGNRRENLQVVEDWFWNKTERIRWQRCTLAAWRTEVEKRSVQVVVVDAQGAGAGAALKILEATPKPVIVLGIPGAQAGLLMDRFPGQVIALAADWQQPGEAAGALQHLLRRLGVAETPDLQVTIQQSDLALMRTLGEMRALDFDSMHGDAHPKPWLRLALAKYFDPPAVLKLEPVSGGWSGTPILKIDDGGACYLKFFRDRAQLLLECKGHIDAKRWLGDKALKIRFPAEMKPLPGSLAEAFPMGTGMFPLCGESVSDGEVQRVTLFDLYSSGPFERVRMALETVLDCLRQERRRVDDVAPAYNWGHFTGGLDTRRFFLFDIERRGVIRDAMHDLRRTLLQLCPDWEDRQKPLLNLANSTFPGWITDKTRVRIGHIHGDLNLRNCLFNPDDPQDIRFIDMGGYLPNGFLIHDLSMLEASIKWAAMGVDDSPRYAFGDIDTGLLRDTQRVEAMAVARGLDFSESDLMATVPPGASTVDCALTRAYSLVAIIRRRAQELSDPFDPEGKHYFAALLGWNLRWLKIGHIRRIKKTLALYSSSLILAKFAGQALPAP